MEGSRSRRGTLEARPESVHISGAHPGGVTRSRVQVINRSNGPIDVSVKFGKSGRWSISPSSLRLRQNCSASLSLALTLPRAERCRSARDSMVVKTSSNDSVIIPVSFDTLTSTDTKQPEEIQTAAVSQEDGNPGLPDDRDAHIRELERRCSIAEGESAALRDANSASAAIEAARRSERSRLEAQGQRALEALEARDAELTRARQELANARERLAEPDKLSKGMQTHNNTFTDQHEEDGQKTLEQGADDKYTQPSCPHQGTEEPSQLPRAAVATCGVQASPDTTTSSCGDEHIVTTADAACVTEGTSNGELYVETGVQVQGICHQDSFVQTTATAEAYYAAARHQRAADEEIEQAREEAEEARAQAERGTLLLREREAQVRTLQDALTAIEEEEEHEDSIEAKLAELARSESYNQQMLCNLQQAQLDQRVRAESAERARDKALERAQRSERRVSDLEASIRALEEKNAHLEEQSVHYHETSGSNDGSRCADAVAEEAKRVYLEHEIKRLRASLDTLRLENAESDATMLSEEISDAGAVADDWPSRGAHRPNDEDERFMLYASDSQVRRRASILARRVRELEGLPQGEQGYKYAEEAASVAKREMRRRVAAERGVVPETRERGTMVGENLPAKEASLRWQAVREALSRRRQAKLTKEAQSKQRESEEKASTLHARVDELRRKECELLQREEELKRRAKNAEEDNKRKDDLVRTAKQRAEQMPYLQSELEAEKNKRNEMEQKLKNTLQRRKIEQQQQQQQQQQQPPPPPPLQQEQQKKQQVENKDSITRRGKCSACERKRIKERELRSKLERVEQQLQEAQKAQEDKENNERKQLQREDDNEVKRKATAELEEHESNAITGQLLTLASASTHLARSVRECMESRATCMAEPSKHVRQLGLSSDEVVSLLSNPSLLAAEDAVSSLKQPKCCRSKREAAISAIERELKECHDLLRSSPVVPAHNR